MAEKTMTASVAVTDGQIDSAVAQFRAALTKHRGDFNSSTFQQALGVKNLGMKVLAPLRAEVESFSKIICRTVTVDRTLTLEAAIAATGRKQYLTADVVASMPQGAGESVTIEFIPLEKWMNDAGVDTLLTEYGLVAVDPFALTALNVVEPEFATKHPCFTHWQDVNGSWCCAAFRDWLDDRGVSVVRDVSGWYDDWVVAGVRK